VDIVGGVALPLALDVSPPRPLKAIDDYTMGMVWCQCADGSQGIGNTPKSE
jgi:hypothetical protein